MATPAATGSSLLSTLPGEPDLNPFAGVDFAELETSLRRPRTLINILLSWLVTGMTLLALIPLFSVVWMLLWRGGRKLSLALFTQLPPAPLEQGGGFGNAIVGTLIIVVLAALISVPLGILSAVFLGETGEESRLAAAVRFAAKVMTGRKLSELGVETEVHIDHIAVKESVFPFNKFFGVDTILGPEMKSTGEVMGIDTNFGAAFWKAQLGAGQNLPFDGNVFLSVKNQDKRNVAFIAKKLSDLGFKIYATRGTAKILANSGIDTTLVNKVSEGRPHVVDMIKNGEIHLIINTPSGRKPKNDEVSIRAGAVQYKIPYTTTISGAQAVVNAIETMKKGDLRVKPLQDYYKG